MREQALESAVDQEPVEGDAAGSADDSGVRSPAADGVADSEPGVVVDGALAPDAGAEGLDGAGQSTVGGGDVADPDQSAAPVRAESASGPMDAQLADAGPPAGVDDEPEAVASQASLELADPVRLRGALEAVLLVVDEPVSAVSLAQTLAVPPPDVQAGLAELRDEYERQGRGIDLREVAGGWRMYSREDYAEYVERFVLDGQRTRLTQAALETLAVIAYRQPVARSRVSAIRGVGVDGVMRTLITRGLIAEAGLDPESGAGLFVTTPLFLEKLGLNSLDELPPLGPLLPDHTDLDAEQDVDTDLIRPPTRSSGAEAGQPPIDVSADD